MRRICMSSRTAYLCDCMESFLCANGISYACVAQTLGMDNIFELVPEDPPGDPFHQRVIIYVYDNRICLKAPVCTLRRDPYALAAQVNALNDEHTAGSLRYNPATGELCFDHYIAARAGIWPGDEALCNALALTQRMAAFYYHEFMFDAAQNRTSDAEGGDL